MSDLENIVKKAKSIVANKQVNIPVVPEAKFKVQKTKAYLKLKNQLNENIPDLGFKVIEGNPFEETYYDKKHKAVLPKFALFRYDRDPVLNIFARIMKEPFHNNLTFYGDTASVSSYIKLKIEEFFSYFETLKYRRAKFLRFLSSFLVINLFVSLPCFLIYNLAPWPKESKAYFIITGIITSISSIFISALIGIDFVDVKTKMLTKSFAIELDHLVDDKVAKLIEDNLEKFNGEIYIAVEAKNKWTMNKKESVIMDPDPLVVGVKKVNKKPVYYLIHQFELTPLEKYITSSEFTT